MAAQVPEVAAQTKTYAHTVNTLTLATVRQILRVIGEVALSEDLINRDRSRNLQNMPDAMLQAVYLQKIPSRAWRSKTVKVHSAIEPAT